MSAHNVIHSKADFDKALETSSKFVLIHFHAGAVSDKADEFASKYKDTCDAYSIDTEKDPKVTEFFGVKDTPAAILYQGGKQVKKVEGKGAAGIEEIAAMLG